MSKELKSSFNFETGMAVAENMIELISSACHRVELAGSLRRKCVTVHDVDIVIHPIFTQMDVVDLFDSLHQTIYIPEVLRNALVNYAKITDETKIIRFEMQNVPVELYLCEPDGNNFEALWQMRTGSAEHNRNLAVRARNQYLLYRAGYGIFRDIERIDDGTEAGIYKALGLDYPKPESRVQ